MSFLNLPPEILTLIATEIDKKQTLESFSLVCSRFRGVARKLLLSSLAIFKSGDYTGERLLEFAIREEGVGAWVKKLKIGHGFSADDGIQVSIISQQLSKFAVYFPNLQELIIRNLRTPGYQLDQVIQCTFIHLTSFTYWIRDDLGLIFLNEILKMTPNLEKFELNCSSDEIQVVTLSSCPVLRELELYTETPNSLFSTPSAFPLHSSSKLRRLDVCFNGGEGNSEDISSILRANKSTLKFLNVSSPHINYSELQGSIIDLISLEILKIERLQGIPQDFLQLISPTIHTLDVPLEKQHLEHYRQNPRPAMSLIEAKLDCWETYHSQWTTWEESDDENYSISKSLTTIHLDAVSGDELVDIHAQIEEYERLLPLKKISFHDEFFDVEDRIENGKVRDFFVSCFKALGVDLEFDY